MVHVGKLLLVDEDATVTDEDCSPAEEPSPEEETDADELAPALLPPAELAAITDDDTPPELLLPPPLDMTVTSLV